MMMAALRTEIPNSERLEQEAGKLAVAFIRNNLKIWFERDGLYAFNYWFAAHQVDEVRKLMKSEFNFELPKTEFEQRWEDEDKEKTLKEEKKNKSWSTKFKTAWTTLFS
jgi:hypothetical protein